MKQEPQIQVEKLVETLLANEPDYFLVTVKIKPTNNIKVYLDGDNGLSIEKCALFNRKLYKLIEEANIFPASDFSLEVSSPGVNEPLKLHRQYVKNIGRQVSIVFNDGSQKEGKLIQVTNNDLVIEQTTGKGKTKQTQQLVIPFHNIKTTTVQIQF
jgi:ribosome maturation factor RimP